MLRPVILLSIIVGLATAAKVKERSVKRVIIDGKSQPTEIVNGVVQVVSPNDRQHVGNHETSEPKFTSGAELSSIAHSSALQAQAAVQGQDTAGSQADFNAKSSLAQAALGAASTAQAALVGKQVIVQGLQHELHDFEKMILSEIAHYQQTQKAAIAAHEAEQQAKTQLEALNNALSKARESAQGASQVASQASGTVTAQHAMIQDAKQRLAHLTEKLHHALVDLHETEVSAHKAAEAAQLAQANAAAAANAIAVNAEKNLVYTKKSDYQ